MKKIMPSIVTLAMVAGTAFADIDDIIERNASAMMMEETFCGNWHNAVISFPNRSSAEVTFGQLILYFRDYNSTTVSSGIIVPSTSIPPRSEWFFVSNNYIGDSRIIMYEIFWTLYSNDNYEHANISLRTPYNEGSEIIRSATSREPVLKIV